VNILHSLPKLSIKNFSGAVNKIVVQAQLFCKYSTSAKLPRVNCSATSKIGILTGTMLVSSELSNTVLINCDIDYHNKKCKPPHEYKLEAIGTDQICVVEREKLQDCGNLSKLVTSFEEEYIWLEVKSVWLIWKQRAGDGFQDWNIDLAKNGQTVYTICVNIGSLDLQAVAGEINLQNVDNDAYVPDIDTISSLNNFDRG
jgi:hypothetical protein